MEPVRALAIEARLGSFEVLRPPLRSLREALASGDPAEALAAARAIARRAGEGDEPHALAACVTGDVCALPPEAAEVIADLIVVGLPVAVPPHLEAPSSALAVRLRCAALLAAPERLPLDEAAPLDLRAVAHAPIERALATGLWRRAAAHARPAMLDRAIVMTRAALTLALLAPVEAQEALLDVARRAPGAVAARALTLLAEPWATGLPCPPLHPWTAGEESARAALGLAEARREVGWVRRFALDEAMPRSVRRAALSALGALGEAGDVAAFIAVAEEDPAGLGAEAIEALRALKRRGVSPDEAEARRVVRLVLDREALPLGDAAECVSSRADAVAAWIDEPLGRGAPKARTVAFLAALGTRRAIARLVEMAESAADPVLSRFALRALGRLEERDAEPSILARLDAEPEACLFALGRMGSGRAVRRLREALADGRPPWIVEALRALLRLDPTPDLLEAAVEQGAISPEALLALPAYAGAAQTEVLARIAAAPGHPFRPAAIGALGRTGGPLAVDPLAALLTDADEAIREQARAALRALGARLGTKEAPLACLEDAPDPGAAMIAEAALRRLRQRSAPVAETALLLDALAGADHPHLVRVVRPYLRRPSPEIRKRAAACLAAAGPSCAPWLLPSLDDAELPVARQALLAIGAAAVPGLAPAVAGWLSHPNMNLKKTAAEALARCGDPAVIPALVEALAHQDQPGLRALLDAALAALAGPFRRSALVEALAAARDPRRADLLAATLAGAFTPDELAALVTTRPGLPGALLRAAYARGEGQLEGRLGALDAELSRRGAGSRIPRADDVPADHPQREGLARADAGRRVERFRARLREAPFADAPEASLVTSLRAAAEGASAAPVALSVPEQRVLAALLSRLDAAARADAVALLAGASDPAVLARVLPHVDAFGELDPRHEPLLAALVARRGPRVARQLATHPSPAVRARAVEVLALSGEGSLADTPAPARAAVLAAWFDQGREEELLAALSGPDALPLAGVAAAVASRAGAAAALSLAERWVARAPAERASALVDLAFLGEVAEPALRALVEGEGRGDVRQRALAALVSLRAASPSFLAARMADEHPGIREDAAHALLRAGDRDDRRRILTAWLAGSFRGWFAVPLDDEDAPAVERAVLRAAAEPETLHLFGPVGALPPACRVPLLLSLRASPHARVAAAARDALRALPPALVLPHVEGRLRSGDLSDLDIIGGAGVVPAVLVELARASTDPASWVRYCRRVAGAGALYAAGLGEHIAAWAADAPSSPALSLLARLTDWYDVAHAEALLGRLGPALTGPRREEILGAVLGALEDQPPALLARVLSRMVRPSDTAAVHALATAEAASPGLSALLPPALCDAVEGALDAALREADPEGARRLLTYFARRAEGRDAERERVLALLEHHLRLGPRRVSLHAHRLLRTLAPRDRYLRATRALLDDPDPTTVRLAIRVLAFGGDAGAAEALAERLSHPHAAVARTAREGLVALGAAAEGPLLRARGRMRPDRRAAVDAVLEEIRARA
jgi:HEAT repeat protein